ncbi:MAG: hypothetical protein CMJ19_24140 [Phycisphaeraceae bacterium]|nr:hypothetical protein [Phycisphaeraceae bacterium]
MHIQTHTDVISACRFCFMCRHLDTTGNVTFREADTPRGRALVLDRIRMNPEQLANPDFINVMYQSTLSAACRKHCVSHYDEAGLVLQARRDIVEQNLVPEAVSQLAQSIQEQFDPKLTGEGQDVLILSTQKDTFEHQLVHLTDKTVQVLQVNDTGKIPSVLGLTDQAKEMAKQIAAMIKKSGCSTVVTNSPAAFDALKNDYPSWEIDWDGITIEHSSTYLTKLVDAKKVTLQCNDEVVYYIDSDYLRNYNDITVEPRQLLEQAGYQLNPFGTNPEESYALGEAAMVLDQLHPKLVQMMVERFKSMMDQPLDRIVTASPYTLRILRGAGIDVMSLEEALLACSAKA